jgi:tetratricopeptide (TPR) repeat protein
MTINSGTSRTILAGLAVVAVAFAGAPESGAQLNPGKIKGTVVDQDGNPAGGLTLLFSPADEGSANSPRKLKVNKKGRFAHSFFPSDTYDIELVETEDRFLKSIVYVLLNDSGLEIDRNEAEAHPTQGLPSVSIRPAFTAVIDLVVAPKEVQESLAMDVAIAEARGPLKEMQDLYETGDYEGVVSKSDEILAEKPNIGPAIYLRGVALWKLGRLEEAREALIRALELVPDQPGILGVTASVTAERADELAAAGQSAKAAEMHSLAADLFGQNLEANPQSRPSLLSRASELDKAGRTDELEAALLEIIEVDPGYLQAYFRLSTLYNEAGRSDDALAVLDRIPGGDESTAVAIYNVAVKLYNADDLAGAEAAARKAIEVDPELPAVRRLLARVYLAQGNDAAAIPEIEKFLELAPDDPEADDERQLLEALKSRAE